MPHILSERQVLPSTDTLTSIIISFPQEKSPHLRQRIVWGIGHFLKKVWEKCGMTIKGIIKYGHRRVYMKKLFASLAVLLSIIFCLSGCNAIGEKNASLTIVYGAAAVLSLLLMIGYCCVVRKKNVWFVVMFSAILVVNIGYFCLAVSSSLSEALLTNRIIYLGQVVLPLAMLMIIFSVTHTRISKWLPYYLLGLSAVMLFIAGSPGYLDIYYKEVSFEIVNGAGTLVKVYGPLHPLYLIYLVGYFAAMIAVIVRAWIKKTVDSNAHAMIIAIAVFVNIGVWAIEQLVAIDFEMLSISYIISEFFLLGVHLMMTEQQRLKDLIRQKEEAELSVMMVKNTDEDAPPAAEVVQDISEFFIRGFETLTARELELFYAYVAGDATKDIMQTMDISENTLKYHSRNLYSKLGVTSRKQMVAVYKRLRASGVAIGEADHATGK